MSGFNSGLSVMSLLISEEDLQSGVGGSNVEPQWNERRIVWFGIVRHLQRPGQVLTEPSRVHAGEEEPCCASCEPTGLPA